MFDTSWAGWLGWPGWLKIFRILFFETFYVFLIFNGTSTAQLGNIGFAKENKYVQAQLAGWPGCLADLASLSGWSDLAGWSRLAGILGNMCFT